METFVNDKIILIGDAVSNVGQTFEQVLTFFQAHGMLPHLGAGAGQGIEDAYALCRLLSHPTTTKSNLDVLYITTLVSTPF